MPKVTSEHVEDRRRQIIDAAYRCFARKGFHQTTMRHICAEAGLSAGAIYTYFKGKEEIIEASFAFDYERGLPIFDAAANALDPMAAVLFIIDAFYAGLESAAALGADRVNIQGWGEAMVNPRLMTPLREAMDKFPVLLSQFIRRGQSAGVFSQSVNADALGQVIVSTYLGLYLQKAVTPELDVSAYRAAVHGLLQSALTQQR